MQEKSNITKKFPIRFRGSAMIPKLNQFSPCRVDLSFDAIESILETLYRRPMFLEVYYVDKSGHEWEINYTNFRKILPLNEPTTPPTPPVKEKNIDTSEYDMITTEEEILTETTSTEEVSSDEDDDTTYEDDFSEDTDDTSNDKPSTPNYQHQYNNQNRYTKHRRK